MEGDNGLSPRAVVVAHQDALLRRVYRSRNAPDIKLDIRPGVRPHAFYLVDRALNLIFGLILTLISGRIMNLIPACYRIQYPGGY